MTDSDSNRGFRKRLLALIDGSGVSDHHLSLLATGNSNTVRNIRRGTVPRLDTLEALCRVPGLRLEMVLLDEPVQTSEGRPAVEAQPYWASRLRKEIRQDLVEILCPTGKNGPAETD